MSFLSFLLSFLILLWVIMLQLFSIKKKNGKREKCKKRTEENFWTISASSNFIVYQENQKRQIFFFFLISESRCINEETESYKVTKDRYTLSLVNYLNSQ